MPEIRLVYFNLRGRAEPIRWILAYAEQPYTDERFDKEKEWPLKKKGVPYGKVPILYVNEKPLSQSVTISRFLGKLFKLSVEDPWMNAVGDEVADAVHDLLPSAVKIIHARLAGNEPEAYLLISQFSTLLKSTLVVLEEKLQQHDWFCGEKITWSDLFVSCYTSQIYFQKMDDFTDFPRVKNHFERVLKFPQIKKWIEERPKTLL